MAMKRVFQILEREDKILQNPFGDVEMKGKRHNIRDKVLSEKEMRDFIDAVPVDNPIDFRNRTILEVLYGTGIRARELCNLELTDIFLDEKMLFIRNGKGKKDRILPLGETPIKYIAEYIKKIRPKYSRLPRKKDQSRKLFLGNFGKALNNRRTLRYHPQDQGRTKVYKDDLSSYHPPFLRNAFTKRRGGY